jgi:hypothetical protein
MKYLLLPPIINHYPKTCSLLLLPSSPSPPLIFTIFLISIFYLLFIELNFILFIEFFQIIASRFEYKKLKRVNSRHEIICARMLRSHRRR